MGSFWIDSSALTDVHNQMSDGHVAYGFGAKASSLDADPSKITKIDCSGYVRYLIYQATDKQISMLDGSVRQHEWCRDQKLAKVAYSTCGENDGWLRIAFYQKTKNHVGHVWLILNGQTLESYGHHGPGSKPWRDRSKIADACYKLAQTYTLTIGPITISTPDAGGP